MDRIRHIEREVQTILDTSVFGRSPTLAAILAYLLVKERTNQGPPTQYDIAREALGKAEDFNETIDSSIRVQMSRLRKALSDHYLTHQPQEGLYLYIRVGEYRLRTAKLERAYPNIAAALETARQSEQLAAPHPPVQSPTDAVTADRDHAESVATLLHWVKEHAIRPIILLMAVLGFFSILLFTSSRPVSGESDLQSHSSAIVAVPYISLDVVAVGDAENASSHATLRQQVEVQARELLLKSLVSRFDTVSDQNPADYHLIITLRQDEHRQYGMSLILTERSNDVVSEFSIPGQLSAAQILQTTEDELIRIVSPAGDITTHRVKQILGKPASDFECFLLVESARIKGAYARSLLDSCIERFPDKAYSPYLRVREAFAAVQEKYRSGQAVGRSSSEWQLADEVLKEHPNNAYANTLAAKLLIGVGQCEDASGYAKSAFSRGRTFPALELAVIVDAYGCSEVEAYRGAWDKRILRIINSNREPHDLLETLILVGALISGQEKAVADLQTPFARTQHDAPLASLNRALMAASRGHATRADLRLIKEMIPAFIFNAQSRTLLYKQLQQRNAQTT